MSHLKIDVAIDLEATHRVWSADVARKLREVADQIEGATGATGIKVDWPDLESWPVPYSPPPDMLP
jgi:hypothetical protein